MEIDDLSLPIGRILFADTLQVLVMDKDLQVLIPYCNRPLETVTGAD